MQRAAVAFQPERMPPWGIGQQEGCITVLISMYFTTTKGLQNVCGKICILEKNLYMDFKIFYQNKLF